jgi:hypothetical protein
MQHRRSTLLTTLAALLLAMLALVGCGGRGDPAGMTPATTTPALDRADPLAVHTAWVQALDAANVEAAAALVAAGSPEERRWFVQGKLDEIQQFKEGKQQWPGAFRSLEVLSIRVESGEQVGYSRWIFEKGTLCYYDKLRQIDGMWAVEGWYQAGRVERCEG